jgi:hypothetical protein
MTVSPTPLIDIERSSVHLRLRGERHPEPTSERRIAVREPRFAPDDDLALLVPDIFRASDGHRILALVRTSGFGPDLQSAIEVRCGATNRILPAAWLEPDPITQVAWLVIYPPPSVSSLSFTFGRQRVFRAVQPNGQGLFAGRRTLFTIVRDESLQHLGDWARWHADRHGFDAALCYLSGSSTHHHQDVARALTSVPGIGMSIALDWPFPTWPEPTHQEREWQAAWSGQVGFRHAIQRFLRDCDLFLYSNVNDLLVTFSGGSIERLLQDEAWDACMLHCQDVVNPDGLHHRALRHQDVHLLGGDPWSGQCRWLGRGRDQAIEAMPELQASDGRQNLQADPGEVRIARFPLPEPGRPDPQGWAPLPAINPACAADSRELRRQLDDTFGEWSWSAPTPPATTPDDAARVAWQAIDRGDAHAAIDLIAAALLLEPHQPALAAALRRLLNDTPAGPTP